jgi:DpnII restriction endonuclease
VLTGKRDDEADRTMAVSYARHALELAKSSPEDIAEKFNTEIGRAARAFSNPTAASHELINLHLRHGMAVQNVVTDSVSALALDLIEGNIEPTSLLGLVVERQHLASSWKRFCDRISLVLENGLPAACVSKLPDNETHLQQICDGLLRAADHNLIREYPYLRWSSRMTKPDFSEEAKSVWVELKYVRSSSDIRHITEEIAADITKYRDNNRRTLFVVYDPEHLVIDEQSFSADIERHEGNLVKIIR